MALRSSLASFVDGKTAGKRDVYIEVAATAEVLQICGVQGDVLAEWPLQRLLRMQDGSRTVLYLAGDPDEARLYPFNLHDETVLAALAPDLDKRRPIGPPVRKVIGWSVAAAAALVVMLFVIIPSLSDQLATVIPAEREERIGKVVSSQIERAMVWQDDSAGESWHCSSAAGDAALAQMVTRVLGPLDVLYTLNVQVVDNPLINAFALPGGQVILFRGLLEAAQSADEVAGVLAHELGHVINRDPMRLTLRAAGSAGLLSLMLGDATGGLIVAGAADQVMNASHTRKAEAQADAFALKLLEEAAISPLAFASFFETLKEDSPAMTGALEWLSSHPSLSLRAQNARDNVQQSKVYRPVLNAQAWRDLQAICG